MNEPAQRCEEQIISLFQDRETLVCQGWILKKMEGRLLVYTLYYKCSQGNIPDNIRKCEETSHRSGMDCVFRIVEHTNYHLSSILTDNGYVLRKCGVVGEWNITEDAGNMYAPRKPQDSLFLKNGTGANAEYVMADADTVIGIKRQELLFMPDGNLPECVMMIDANLPLGIIANTAAIMGITLGKQMPEVVGADVYDKTGNGHLGIIEFPVPILKGNVDVIKAIREKLYEPEFSELTVVDFSDLAQGCKTYDEFIEKMKDVSETELNYFKKIIVTPDDERAWFKAHSDWSKSNKYVELEARIYI